MECDEAFGDRKRYLGSYLSSVCKKMSSIWGYTVFFEAENPAALQEITAVMLETARKGYWKATEEQLKEISGLHVRFISEHGPACSDLYAIIRNCRNL